MLAPFAWRSLRLTPVAGIGAGLSAGVLLATAYGLQTAGLELTTVASTGFITGLYVVFTPLLALVLFGTAVPRALWLGVALTVLGLLLLSGIPGGSALGNALVLANAVFQSFQITAMERFAPRYDPRALTFLQMATSFVGFTVIAVSLGELEVPRGATVWGALLVTGLFAGAITSSSTGCATPSPRKSEAARAMAHAIEVSHVTKVYRRYGRRRQFATLKSAIVSGTMVRDLRPEETFPALEDVSFSVTQGQTYGIVGRNGSGKSTALKVVAGITKPNAGSVRVEGRVSALIEHGAGFHPEISGRENVFINGIMLGLWKREVARRFDETVAFAELDDFIDAPVKTYSSGMYMRLGLAVAIHVDPDILLVDEVLAVGDEALTHKCLDKFREFRRRGKTVLLVTHQLGLGERFCDEVLWLDQGRKQAEGDPRRVVGAYMSAVEQSEAVHLASENARAREAVDVALPAQPPECAAEAAAAATPAEDGPRDMFQATEGRWGSRQVEIVDVALLDGEGQPGHIFNTGAPMTIRLQVQAHAPVDDFVFGVGLFPRGRPSSDGSTSKMALSAARNRNSLPSTRISLFSATRNLAMADWSLF